MTDSVSYAFNFLYFSTASSHISRQTFVDPNNSLDHSTSIPIIFLRIMHDVPFFTRMQKCIRTTCYTSMRAWYE